VVVFFGLDRHLPVNWKERAIQLKPQTTFGWKLLALLVAVGLLAASPGIPGFDLDSQQSHASVNPAATANTPSAIAFPSRESFKSGGGVPLRLKHLSPHQSKLVHSPLLSKAELLPGPGSLRRSLAYPLSKLGRSPPSWPI
jgi:hypothetical protein